MLGRLRGIWRDLILHIFRGGGALIESAPLHFISTGGIRGRRGSTHGRVVLQAQQKRQRAQTNRQVLTLQLFIG